MIKCGVCGSENEAQALFCGTCGSTLTPADAKVIADEARTVAAETPRTDESVVPGKGGARRDLGTGGDTGKKPVISEVPKGGGTTPVTPEAEPDSSGPTIICSVCGTVNDPSRTYCRKCANELKPMAAAAPPAPAPTPGRRISPVIVGLAAAGVVVALGVGLILGLGGVGPSASSTPALTAQVTLGPSVTTAPPSQGTPPTDSLFTEGDPEGRIVFARCVGTSECVLFMINADGSEVGALTVIEDGSATDPAFSNDGKQVAFTRRDGLRILDIDAGNVSDQSNARGESGAFFSPDDSKLTFAGRRDREGEPPPTDDREIRLDDVLGGTPSEPLTSNKADDHDPVFTLDGTAVIWVQGEGTNRELKRIELGSRTISNLTSDNFEDVDPAVSPDGKTVAFAGKRGGDGFDLFLLDLATLEITPLPTMPGDEHDPAWSPGGRYLVFSGGDPASNNLFLLDLADGSFDEITSTDDRDLAPAWRR